MSKTERLFLIGPGSAICTGDADRDLLRVGWSEEGLSGLVTEPCPQAGKLLRCLEAGYVAGPAGSQFVIEDV